MTALKNNIEKYTAQRVNFSIHKSLKQQDVWGRQIETVPNLLINTQCLHTRMCSVGHVLHVTGDVLYLCFVLPSVYDLPAYVST